MNRAKLLDFKKAKLIGFILSVFIGLANVQAQTYAPSTHTVVSRPIGMPKGSIDARSQFYDATHFVYRDYVSTAEVLSYLSTANFRSGKFPIFINSTGTLNSSTGVITGGSVVEYWFKDGVTDGDLIIKISGAGTSAWSTITGTPTTLSGYGITDAYPLTGNPSGFLTSYTETDPTVPSYAKSLTGFSAIQTSTDLLYRPITYVPTFSSITGKPTTYSGYGITDVYPLTGNPSNFINALTGDGTASGPGSAAFTLATVNSNVGAFGSASSVSSVTLNAKGLVTAAVSTAIQINESQVTGLTSDLASKAPIASPTFTGTVTAPAFVGALTGNASTATNLQTSRLIQGVSFNGSADINPINGTGFVKATGTTISYDNTAYAPLASPTFTGVPTAPTATVGTNTTQLATTAFVLANSGGPTPTLQAVATAGNTTTTNIGIGTTSPLSALHVATTSTSTPRGILSDQNTSDALGSRITMRKSRGTPSSPTTIVSGDVLGTWTASGHDGTNYIDAAKILVSSTGTISTGIVPTTMQLQTMSSAGALTTGLTITPTLAQGTNLVATGSNQQEYYTSVFFGNSITKNGLMGALASTKDSDYVSTVSRGLHVLPDNRGIGGSLATSVFSTVDVPYDNKAIKFYFVMFDTNDCTAQVPLGTYQAQLNALIDSMVTLRNIPKSKIILMSAPYSTNHRTIPLTSYTAVSANTASTKGITYIENYSYMATYQAAHPTQVLLATDSTHLTNLGHAVLAAHILSQLSAQVFVAKGAIYADTIVSSNLINANYARIGYATGGMYRPDTLYSRLLKTDKMMPGSVFTWGATSATINYLMFYDDITNSSAKRTGLGLNSTGAELVLFSYGSGGIGGMRFGLANDASTMTDGNSTMYINSGGFLHINKIVGPIDYGNLNIAGEYFTMLNGGSSTTRTGLGLVSSGATMVFHGYGSGGQGGMRFVIGQDAASSTDANSAFWLNINNVLNINNKFTLYGTSAGILTVKAPGSFTSYEFDLPTTAGTAGQIFTTQGGGGTASTWTTLTNQVVASADLTAQTAAGNITTYANGASDASFTIAANLNVTAVTTDVIQTQITYTDETNTSRTVIFYPMGTTTPGISTTGVVNYPPMSEVRVKASTTITVATVLTTGVGSITFNGHASITKIR